MNVPSGTPVIRSEVGDAAFEERYHAPLRTLQMDTDWLVQKGVPADEIVYVEPNGGLYLDLESVTAMLHQVPLDSCHFIRNDPEDLVTAVWAGDMMGIARVLKRMDIVYVYQRDKKGASPTSRMDLQIILMSKILHCQSCVERYSLTRKAIWR